MSDHEEEGGEELAQKLDEVWDNLLKTQKSSVDFVKNSQIRLVEDNDNKISMIAFFNPMLDINRFFIEDSDGQKAKTDAGAGAQGGEMPGVEFGNGSTGFADNSDPFEDDLEDAMCVFKSGDGNTDILEKNDKLILFYVDLENEEFIDKQTNPEEQKEDMGQVGESKHPLLFNQYPLCKNHSIMLQFAEAGLPQVLSDEILALTLQIFKLSDTSSLRVGYNSMGADCLANNLHYHLVYADQMNKDTFKDQADNEQFPIEKATKKLFYKSLLQHKNKDEINMYSCPVRFGELTDWPCQTLILSPDIDNQEISLEDAQEALAHTAGIVLNYLIDQNIPHNILMADEGMTLYIIPRKFDLLIENIQFFTSFETLCGFIKFKTQKAFNDMTATDIKEQLELNVSIGEEDFSRMKDELVEKFEKEYEGSRIQ